jgi:hypothetical protein
LAVFCFILLLILGRQDDKNVKLAAENGLLKGRMETLQERGAIAGEQSTTANEPLTVDGIEAAVRHAGYVPDTSDDWVRFMVAGERFFIDTSRLPQIFISRYYSVQTSEWDMELLKKAAHLMSDDLIMVKAIFDEKPDGTTLRFFVAAMDRNYPSFRDNLMSYLGIISDGNQRMTEIYNKLEEEKKNPALAGTPFTAAYAQGPKLLS